MANKQEQSFANDNLALLEAMVENTEMGKNTLNEILPMTEDPTFRAELLRELNQYRQFNQQAHTCMAACGAEAKGQTAFAKLNTKLGIELGSLTDKSTRKLAQMLVQGSEKGVDDCIIALRDYPNASSGARSLTDDIRQFEAANAQQLRSFF